MKNPKVMMMSAMGCTAASGILRLTHLNVTHTDLFDGIQGMFTGMALGFFALMVWTKRKEIDRRG
jgi:phosphatidylserine synthase